MKVLLYAIIYWSILGLLWNYVFPKTFESGMRYGTLGMSGWFLICIFVLKIDMKI